MYSKEVLALYMGLLEFAHILWEKTKPAFVLTDIKSITRFFQTKAFPPLLWTASDCVWQLNVKKARTAGSLNTAVDFVSRIEFKDTKKIFLKVQEDIQTIPVDKTISSWDVADAEQFFLIPADNENESDQETHG